MLPDNAENGILATLAKLVAVRAKILRNAHRHLARKLLERDGGVTHEYVDHVRKMVTCADVMTTMEEGEDRDETAKER